MDPSAGVRFLIERLAADAPALVAAGSARVAEEVPEYLDEPDLPTNMGIMLARFYGPLMLTTWIDERPDAERVRIERRMRRGLHLVQTLKSFTIVDAEITAWVLERLANSNGEVNVGDAQTFLRMWEHHTRDAREGVVRAHQAISRQQISGDLLERRRLLSDLMDGSLDPDHAVRRLRGLGLEVGVRSYVVVIRHRQTLHPATANGGQSLVGKIESLVTQSGQPLPFVVATEHRIVAICWGSKEGAFDATALQRLTTTERELEVRCGVSLPCADLRDFKRAHAEADEALDLTSADQPFISMADFTPFDFMLTTTSDRLLELAPPDLMKALSQDDSYTHELIETISQYMQAGMNAGRTAEALHIHTNTVYYRLSRIEHHFGVDTRDQRALLDLLIIVRTFNRRRDAARRPGTTTVKPNG